MIQAPALADLDGVLGPDWDAPKPDERLKTPAAAIGQPQRCQESNPDQVFGNLHQEDPRAFGEPQGSCHLKEELAMDVRIIDLPKAHVAYQRLIGPYGPAIGQFWRHIYKAFHRKPAPKAYSFERGKYFVPIAGARPRRAPITF